jgi:hypothetical protein
VTGADHRCNAAYILGRPGLARESWSVDVCTSDDERVDYLFISTRRGSVKGEDTSKNGVDGLALVNGILNQTEVASGAGPV